MKKWSEDSIFIIGGSIIIAIFILLTLIACAPTPETQVTHLARVELHDTNDTQVECPPGMTATRAKVSFWQNGSPKALEMECR